MQQSQLKAMNRFLLTAFLFFLGSQLIFGQNDECTTATSLGTLPAPAACPTENGTPLTVTGTTVGATAESPYEYLINCNAVPGPSDDMYAPAADVWYSFVASGTVLDVTITSAMSNMTIGLWTGSCGSLVGAFCDVSATGNLTATFEPLTPGVTYYVQLSGGSEVDQGTFSLTLENYLNCDICMTQSTLTATPPPTGGYYPPNTTVTFCLNVDSWVAQSTNWLHGVVPSFGSAWDLTTLTPVSDPGACSGGGESYDWYWETSNTSTATGLTTGPGFYVDYDPPGGGPGGGPDGNTGNNFGDPCAIGTALVEEFCWSIKTVSVCASNYDLGMTVNTLADGESGAWNSIACTGDPEPTFNAQLICCESIVNAGADETICADDVTSLNGSYSNTTGSVTIAWTSSPAGALAGLSSTTTLTPTFTPPSGITGPVTFTLSVTDDACTQVDNVAITVTALPTASISYSAIEYCSNAAVQNVTLSGTGAYTGGTYTSTPGGLTINGTSGAITPSSSVAGTYTVTYTVPASGGCGTVTATASVTVTALPTATISYTTPVCSNAAVQNVALSGTGAYTGGTYTSTPGGLSINSSTGDVTPSLSTAGSYTVTYTIPASGGCGIVTATASIVITAVPTASISYTTPICSNAGLQTVSLSGTGAYTGGTYTSLPGGLSINAINGEITPSTSTAGTYTVTYTVPVSGGCGTVTATASIVITTLPTATISYSSPVCTDASIQTVTLNGTDAYTGGGYVGSSVALTIDGTTGSITPSTSTPGSYTITYTVPASAGCGTVTATAGIEITALPTAAISYSSPICSDASVQGVNLSGTGAYTGGSFSSSPSGLTVDASTGAVTPSSSTPGSYTVTYLVPASAGCGTVTATATIVITPLPTATLSYSGPFCSNDVTSQTASLTGTGAYTGGAYTSLPGGLTINATTGDVTPSTSTPGTYTVTYTVPASGGCSIVTATATVVVTEAPTAALSYAGPYCTSSTSQSAVLSGTGLYLGGAFSSPAGLTLDASTGSIDPGTSTPGTYTVTYTIPAVGGCASSTVTASVTIDPVPVFTVSGSDPSICNGSDGSVTLSGLDPSTSYNVTYSDDATVVGPTVLASNGTGDIIIAGLNAGTYDNIIVAFTTTGCGATDIAGVSLSNPGAPNVDDITNVVICDATYTLPAITGTSLTGAEGYYSGPNGTGTNYPVGTVISTLGSTLVYIYDINGACADQENFTITINSSPTASISYSEPFCENTLGTQAVTLSGTNAYTGGTYSSTAGLSISAGTGAVTPSTSATGTYVVTYTYPSSGGCSSGTTTVSVTITPLPTATIDYVDPFCTTDATAQLVSLSGTNTYTGGGYSSTSGLTIDPVTGDINASTSTSGSYTVTYTVPASGGCSTVPVTTTVLITQGPTASISYPSSPYCSSVSGAQPVTLSGSGSYLGGAFSSDPALNLNTSSGAIDPSLSSPGSYTVTYTFPASGGCPVGTTTATVTITALPTATIDYADPFCSTDASSQTVNLNGTNAYSGGSFSSSTGLTIDPVNGDINASSSTAGTYTVTYTLPVSGGCSAAPVTTSVQINQGPTASISYPSSPYCSTISGAQLVTLSGTGSYLGGGYISTSGLDINAVNGAIDPSISAAGTYTVTYTFPATGGCPAGTATASVTITEVPTAAIDFADPFCTSDATLQNVTITGTAAYTGGAYASSTGLTIDPLTGEINASTTAAGTYTVTYTIPASGGCAAVDATTTVGITEAPTASISYNGPYCESFVGTDAVNLTGTAAYAGGSFSIVGGGLTLNTVSGLIEPSTSTPGTYVVTYDIPASGGCPSDIATASVTINPTPVFTVSSTDPTVCNGTDGTITIAGLTASTSYDVSYDDDGTLEGPASLSSDASGNITLSGLNAGTYDNFVLTLNGCSGSDATVLTLVNPGAPQLNNPGDQSVCETYTLPAITGTLLTGSEAYWTQAGGTGTQLNVGDVITSSQTIYIYDQNGTCSDEVSFVVTVYQTPSINNPGNQSACESYTLGAITGTNLSGNEAYYDDAQSNGAVVVTGPITTSQTIWIYDFNTACDNEVSFVVTINQNPTFTSIDGGSVYCAGDVVGEVTVALAGTPGFTVTYTVDGGAPQTATGATSPVVLGNGPGVYTVTEIADANCTTTATGTQTITINPIPSAPNAGSDSVYCSNWTLVPMTASGTGTFTWYADAALSNQLVVGNNLTPQSTVGTTTYYVTETISGCEGPATSVTITINDCEIVVPTAFTPNGDNVNDFWEIVDLDQVYPTSIVYVYNRWGNLVYESNKGSYTSKPWDGTYNGDKLPVASYYYMIDLNESDDELLKGTVTIIQQ
jgi:gliding motility-associated-like protein